MRAGRAMLRGVVRRLVFFAVFSPSLWACLHLNAAIPERCLSYLIVAPVNRGKRM